LHARLATLLALLQAGFLSALIIRRMAGAGSNNWDLGIFTQATHNLARGEFFMNYRGMDIFGHHTNFGLFFLAPVSWLGGGATALSVIQALALTAGAWPVYLLGRDRIAAEADVRVKGFFGLALAVVWLLHPTVTGLSWWMFHPESLALAAIVGAWWAACRRHWGRCLLLVLWVVLQREDLPLAMAGFGLAVLLVHRTNRTARRVGIGVAVACLALWVFLTQVFMPARLGTDDPYYVKDFWGHLGTTMPEVLGTVAADPPRALEQLTNEERASFLTSLLLPTGGTALLSPLTLAPAVPQLVAVTLSNDEDSRQVWHHHGALYLAFSVISAAETIRWVRLRRLGAAKVVTTLAVTGSILSYLLMAPTPLGLQADRWPGATTESVAMHEALSLIPPTAAVAATVTPGNLIADRTEAFVWPNPWLKWKRGFEYADLPDPDRVDYLLLLDREVTGRTEQLLQKLLAPSGPFVVVRQGNGVLLAARPAS
jgi:uncharacterized membrane protein